MVELLQDTIVKVAESQRKGFGAAKNPADSTIEAVRSGHGETDWIQRPINFDDEVFLREQSKNISAESSFHATANSQQHAAGQRGQADG